MTRQFAHLMAVLAIGVLVSTASPPDPAPAAGGQTARHALPRVIAAARKWQPDAILVGLASVAVGRDGTSAEWKYAFYSPKTTKRFVVTAGRGKASPIRMDDSRGRRLRRQRHGDAYGAGAWAQGE
jgi:hypothetical protein